MHSVCTAVCHSGPVLGCCPRPLAVKKNSLKNHNTKVLQKPTTPGDAFFKRQQRLNWGRQNNQKAARILLPEFASAASSAASAAAATPQIVPSLARRSESRSPNAALHRRHSRNLQHSPPMPSHRFRTRKMIINEVLSAAPGVPSRMTRCQR